MLKQHCDICDGVIPGTEQYRTIHFGRGYNTNVDTGYDPLIICKHCWHKMLESVDAVDLYRDIDGKKRPSQVKPVRIDPKEIVNGLELDDKTEFEKKCKTCKYGSLGWEETHCSTCKGLNNWEAKTDEESSM